MKKRRIGRSSLPLFLCAVMMLLCLVPLAACGGHDVESGAGQSDYPVTINEVTLSAEPEGVAVLSPNLADVVLALRYEVSLKARSEDCTQSDLAILPTVSLEDPQAIRDSGATLVLTEEAPTEEQKKAAADAGLTILVLSPATNREDLTRLYTQVGSAFKGAATGYHQGEKIAKNILMTIDDVRRVIPESDVVVTVCFLLDDQGGAITGDCFAGKLIESLGFANAANDGAGNQVELSVIANASPSYLFCPTGMKDTIAAAEAFKDLEAVQQGRIFEIDPHLLQWQGNSITQGITEIVGSIYPELLSDSSGSSAASQPPESSGAAATTELKPGDENETVKNLQLRLQELGYLFVSPTGLYGEGTEQSVKDFQLLNGLEVTGIADEQTLELLYSDAAKPRTD